MKKYILALLFLPSIALAAPDVCALAEFRLQEVQHEWSHDGFYRMTTPLKSATSTRGTYRENLARKFTKQEDVYTAWANSPSHRKNLEATSTASCLRSANNHWVLITWSPYRTI